jgi:drug/metabolite transporter (DMT)-like permease
MGLSLVVGASLFLYQSGWARAKIGRKGFLYVGMVVVSLGWAWTLDKVVAPWFGAALYTAIACGPPALLNAFLSKLTWREVVIELRNSNRTFYMLPLLTVIGYFSLIKALTLGEVSRVVPVATATTPMVVILGLLFLGEKDHWLKKVLLAGITMVGIWILGR